MLLVQERASLYAKWHFPPQWRGMPEGQKKKKDRDRESHYIYASADTKLDLLMLIDSLDQIDHEFVIDTD